MNALPAAAEPVADLLPEGWDILDQMPDGVLLVARDGPVFWVNAAVEAVLQQGRADVLGRHLDDLLGKGSVLAGLCASIGPDTVSLRERAMLLSGPPPVSDGVYDVQITCADPAGETLIVTLREQGFGNRLEGAQQGRGTARSLSGLATALAHEVKNPLSGIRGAAQLLESAVGDPDRDLARLIADEVDRICSLLDRMEAFSERHPVPHETLNIHEVLDHVARLSRTGMAERLTVVEHYDPSLPPIDGNRDALIQVFLNLVKNAAEACGPGGTIRLGTSYDGSIRHGGGRHLPLVVTVTDDGPGIPDHLMETLFEPFVSGSETRSGLGLSLVARMVDSHGGIVSADRLGDETVFRVALPFAQGVATP
ncbi:MAG: PAS domain-containing protein [Rhodospirillales bacterium]|nr:PAS domain-containing protein [Rhodospirillales bacterium]